MIRRARRAVDAAPLLLLLACSGSSSNPARSSDAGSDVHTLPPDGGTVSIGVGGYDVSCQKSSDCVLVDTGQWTLGDPCCGNGCPSAAINASAQTQYDMALSQVQAQCAAARGDSAGACGEECIAVQAFCSAGKCAVCTGVDCADGGAPGDAAAE